MRNWFSTGLVAAAIVLPALSNAAWADACSDATLRGEYAFGVTAYTPAGLPEGPPEVVAGIKVFDGHGNLTQRDYQGDTVPAAFAPAGRETGTYHVDPDCTGSMDIDLNVPNGGGGEIQILFVISNGGRHIHEVVSQFTPPFATGPAHPTHTSADDWKVAPEQNEQ